jgi:hypothetical protein
MTYYYLIGDTCQVYYYLSVDLPEG